MSWSNKKAATAAVGLSVGAILWRSWILTIDGRQELGKSLSASDPIPKPGQCIVFYSRHQTPSSEPMRRNWPRRAESNASLVI